MNEDAVSRDKSFAFAAVQMKTGEDKEKNIEKALFGIEKAAEAGADIAVLPEMFCCPYDNKYFLAYAERADGDIVGRLSSAAAHHGIYVVGGSFPELADDGKLFNSSFAFGRDGRLLARHRKVHLYDVDIPGKMSIRESDIISPGDAATVFDTEFGTFGLCICYDIRFPELFRMMVDEGAEAVFCPAVFNRTTGPRHWELAMRSRAVDNQIFMMGISQAADETASYISYGHSIAVSPWGDVLAQAGDEETLLIQDIDLKDVREVREQLPLLRHRRPDVYGQKL